jgi:hypothetical protein
MRNSDVIRSFTMSREGRAGNLSTDGKVIHSYNLVIGFNLAGETYAIDYTSTGGHYKSQTTSTHVNSLKRTGGVKCISVEEWEHMFKSLVFDSTNRMRWSQS